jgi:hypothetical protein
MQEEVTIVILIIIPLKGGRGKSFGNKLNGPKFYSGSN